MQDVQRRWPAIRDAGPGAGDPPPPVLVRAGDPGLHRGEHQAGHPGVLGMYVYGCMARALACTLWNSLGWTKKRSRFSPFRDTFRILDV